MSAVLNNPEINVRPMQDSDLAQVMVIDKTVYPFPWTESIFRDCLHVGYCCWVMEQDDEVVAYSILSIGAAEEAHLLNLSVNPDFQRQGLGESLLQHMIELAREHAASTVFLEVRPSNEAAIKLYDKYGFCQVGVRNNYYPAKTHREDALILALEL